MIYLIKRGPRTEHHNAPYHPVIICNKKRIALWEAGSTKEKANVWGWFSPPYGGLLLVRWNGLDIDYGGLVKEVGPLPDGTHTAFFHDRDKEPFTLVKGAIWWDDKKMPKELENLGVIYPPDQFTQQSILDRIVYDGFSGFRREIPSFWPKPQDCRKCKPKHCEFECLK